MTYYSDMVRRLIADILLLTHQMDSPIFVLLQGAGFRSTGAAGAALAGGHFEYDNPDLEPSLRSILSLAFDGGSRCHPRHKDSTLNG